MLRGMATVCFWADDVEAAKAWYTGLLGVDPYFERSGPDGRLAYAEFRLGDFQDELGLIDRRYAPGADPGTGGAVVYWHVDDVAAALERLPSSGAEENEPLTAREAGFTTASVVDPFGNVLGVMYNPHYLDIFGRIPEFDRPAIETDVPGGGDGARG
ncbi:VOC family protein [Nocardiopsis mangrovi]|uniref:VOC family protein n=1 Tax=Nocardiopsis mangrovi TaxID=1179818 RepID=A0ABV9DS28_9ACTN